MEIPLPGCSPCRKSARTARPLGDRQREAMAILTHLEIFETPFHTRHAACRGCGNHPNLSVRLMRTLGIEADKSRLVLRIFRAPPVARVPREIHSRSRALSLLAVR